MVHINVDEFRLDNFSKRAYVSAELTVLDNSAVG